MCFFQFSVIVETSEIKILEKGLTLLHRFGISLHEMVIRQSCIWVLGKMVYHGRTMWMDRSTQFKSMNVYSKGRG